MRFRRQRYRHEGINVTPLIDVVFLLLIFFMVSTTFTRETRLAVELPEAEGEQLQEEMDEVIEVIVDATGGFAVNGRVLVNRDVETLMSALEETSADDTSKPITITADTQTPHGAVVTVMDAAGRLGFSKLRFATREPEENRDDH